MQRIKAVIIFIIGMAIVAAGAIIFLFYPGVFGENYRTYSFGMMIGGLFLVAVGSVRGKKKLTEHKMKKDPFEKMLKKMDKEKKTVNKKERIENERFFQKLGFTPSFSRNNPVTQAGNEKVVRVLICPGCGAENPETHSFCSECGKLIKSYRKPPKSPDIQAIRGMVKTGAKVPGKAKTKKGKPGGKKRAGKPARKPVKKAVAKKPAKKPLVKKPAKKTTKKPKASKPKKRPKGRKK